MTIKSMNSALQRLIDFAEQSGKDEQHSSTFLQRRDRLFAAQLPPRLSANARLGRWLEARRGDVPSTGAASSRLLRQLRWLLVIIGGILGAITLTSVLQFDGRQQINLLSILLLILAQCLMTLLSAWASVRRPAHTPMFASGRLGGLLIKLLPKTQYQLWQNLIKSAPSMVQAGALSIPILLLLSQYFSWAFSVGALLSLLVMVSTQDLAFGWSTTLQIAPDSVHRFFSALSKPWANWWPDAAATLDLVRNSQFYRLADHSIANPAKLGQWWLFIFMAWMCYSLIPRTLLLLFNECRWQCLLQRNLQQHPAYAGFIRRLTNPLIDTAADIEDDGQNAATVSNTSDITRWPGAMSLVHWAAAWQDAPAIRQQLQLNAKGLSVTAGGSQSLADDQLSVQKLKKANQAVMILCQQWEPPLAELADFIDLLRQNMSDVTAIYLLPAALSKRSDNDADFTPWRRFVERHTALQIKLLRRAESL